MSKDLTAKGFDDLGVKIQGREVSFRLGENEKTRILNSKQKRINQKELVTDRDIKEELEWYRNEF